MYILRRNGHVSQEVHLKDYSEGNESNKQSNINQVGLDYRQISND